MRTFEIECGEHRGKVKAEGMGEAWRKLTADKTEGFAPLARVREVRRNGTVDVWRYTMPQFFDELQP